MTPFQIPKCKCGKPCKKARNGGGTMGSLNYGYYMTCGEKECLSNRDKKNYGTLKDGKKRELPDTFYIHDIYKNQLFCHWCKKPKEVGRNACNDCLERGRSLTTYKYVTNKILIEGIIKKRNKKQYLARKNKQTKLVMSDIEKQAKKLLLKSKSKST